MWLVEEPKFLFSSNMVWSLFAAKHRTVFCVYLLLIIPVGADDYSNLILVRQLVSAYSRSLARRDRCLLLEEYFLDEVPRRKQILTNWFETAQFPRVCSLCSENAIKHPQGRVLCVASTPDWSDSAAGSAWCAASGGGTDAAACWVSEPRVCDQSLQSLLFAQRRSHET